MFKVIEMANIFDLFKQISSSEPKSTRPITYIVAGLGNPERKYDKTRHNAGFMALDYIAEKKGAVVNRAKFKSLVGECEISGQGVLLMKPQTYMNNSGEAVAEAARFYKIAPENIIVISDDITLDVGRIRVRRKGSHGGHNGLKDIIRMLSTENYPRIKLGVGQKPHPDYDVIDWVLGQLPENDLATVKATFPTVLEGLEKMVAGDIDAAMQICNKK